MLRAALLALCLLAACAPTHAQAPPAGPSAAKPFKMRMYTLVILRKGPRWAPRSPEVKSLLEGHMANIRRLGAAGKLLIAGPTDGGEGAPDDTPVGIFIFDTASVQEATELTATDPTVAAGHFAAQVLAWYGPQGLTYDGQAEELAKLRAGKP